MASHWVKSCKSTSAANDVVDEHRHKPPKHRPIAAAVPSTCRKGVQSLKDVIETTKPGKPKKKHKQPSSVVAPEPGPNRGKKSLLQTVTVAGPLSPALSELPSGHPSRNVVEIIFRSGWSPEPFSGLVEMVLKVRNSPGTAARFEEYREKVKARAKGGGEDHARCAADGNEVMGFHCLGPTEVGLEYDGAWDSGSRKGAVCVFSGGGEAHKSSGGGGLGRRAMLVCRVIAGRVCKRVGLKAEGRVGFDSVSGEKGELVVCDPRAVLPCFLILYKL